MSLSVESDLVPLLCKMNLPGALRDLAAGRIARSAFLERFGHRGAALGLITGWGGTQRLPRLIGKGRALQMFCAAEKVAAPLAFEIGLVHAIADDPLQEVIARLNANV